MAGMKKSWWLLVIVSLGVIAPFAAPYLTFDAANSRVNVAQGSMQFPLLLAHILFALAALLAGFVQFIPRIREERPRMHRLCGRIYVVSVIVSALLALPLVGYMDNFAKATGFAALALIWLFTTWKGYRAAIRRDYAAHRAWMIRSFGITLVAVSGRLLVPVLLLTYAAQHGFSLPAGREGMVEDVLNVNIWAGLIVNMMIVEWRYSSRSEREGLRQPRTRRMLPAPDIRPQPFVGRSRQSILWALGRLA